MKTAERIVMVAIVCALVGGGVWGYAAVKHKRLDFRERVAAGEFEIREKTQPASTTTAPTESEWRRYYPVTYDMTIGDVAVEASVADTLTSRIKGLSDTPYLPEGVVKLFAFGTPGSHSIWMKDMNYPLDILWVNESGTIVHIEEDVSPDTYIAANPQASETFASPIDAWFVIETNAGFVSEHGIEVGSAVSIPQ